MALFLPYAHCYCEENVYKCLERVRADPDLFDHSFAVFMSSYSVDPSRETLNQWASNVPYRSFKTSDLSADFVIWDYHVVAVVRCKANRQWFVIDRDTSLSCSQDPVLGSWGQYCVEFEFYCSETLFLERSLAAPLKRRVENLMDAVRYRAVDGETYLCFFRSDRSHMVRSSGEYSQKPPRWPPIQGFPVWASVAEREKVQPLLEALGSSFAQNNLTCLINMANTLTPGIVMNRRFFSSLFCSSQDTS